jgi:hypothetical protein
MRRLASLALALALFALLAVPILADSLFLPAVMWRYQAPVINRVFVVGNSISYHPVKPEIGWDNDWGMAATSIDRDYVHRLAAMIGTRQSAPPTTRVFRSTVASLTQRAPAIIGEIAAIQPDLIIVQVSDNMPESDATQDSFYTPYASLLESIRGVSGAQIICVGSWSSVAPVRDGFILEAATINGAAFVPITDLSLQYENRAESQMACLGTGICWHPSDAGMERIAERIMQALG